MRVTAAIHLSLRDEQRGLPYLQEFVNFPGDPGVLAALNLARRGHKEAVERALLVLAEYEDWGVVQGSEHGNLQQRLQLLLSNSAAFNNVPQYAGTRHFAEGEGKNSLQGYMQFSSWWNKHKDRIALYDPWFDELRDQLLE